MQFVSYFCNFIISSFNTASSKSLNVPLKDLELSENVLIGGIIRDHQIIIPSGTTAIKEKDSVIVVSKGRILNDLDDILA